MLVPALGKHCLVGNDINADSEMLHPIFFWNESITISFLAGTYIHNLDATHIYGARRRAVVFPKTRLVTGCLASSEMAIH